MTSRDKALRAVSREGPAPFPKHLRPCPELVDELRAMTGAEDLDSHFGLDLRWLYCGRPEGFEYDHDLSETEFGDLFDFDQVARQADELRERGLAVLSQLC